jgi:hypothetical protein
MPSGILSDVNPLMLSLRFNAGQASQDVADDPILVDLIASLHIPYHPDSYNSTNGGRVSWAC